MADPRRKDATWTSTGRVIRPLDPNPADISIEDIAHHLGNMCRFTGGTREFYSVAQHSVLVSQSLERNMRQGVNYNTDLLLWGLLHDAPEAYISDLARPVKKSEPIASVYEAVEQRLMDAVAERFELRPLEMPPEVHDADRALGRAESALLMPPNFNMDSWGPEPSFVYARMIEPWAPGESRRRFLERFKELY